MSNATSITPEFVKAIRKAARDNDYANRYWVRVEAIRHESWNGTILTLAREHSNGDNASESYTTFYDVVGCGRVASVEHFGTFDSYVGTTGPARRYCAVQNHSRSDKGLLSSLANVLKVGDEVRARFLLNNSTDNLKKAGLEHDTCFLQVIRNGKFVCEFFVDDTICPIGSSALFSYQYVRDIEGHIATTVAPFLAVAEEVAS